MLVCIRTRQSDPVEDQVGEMLIDTSGFDALSGPNEGDCKRGYSDWLG